MLCHSVTLHNYNHLLVRFIRVKSESYILKRTRRLINLRYTINNIVSRKIRLIKHIKCKIHSIRASCRIVLILGSNRRIIIRLNYFYVSIIRCTCKSLVGICSPKSFWGYTSPYVFKRLPSCSHIDTTVLYQSRRNIVCILTEVKLILTLGQAKCRTCEYVCNIGIRLTATAAINVKTAITAGRLYKLCLFSRILYDILYVVVSINGKGYVTYRTALRTGVIVSISCPLHLILIINYVSSIVTLLAFSFVLNDLEVKRELIYASVILIVQGRIVFNVNVTSVLGEIKEGNHTKSGFCGFLGI